jgi:hypothetical protein
VGSVCTIQASWACCFSVRFSGFFHRAAGILHPGGPALSGRAGHLWLDGPGPFLPSLVRAAFRASFNAARRTSSRAWAAI